MDSGTRQQRRAEQRLSYNWPIWFAEDFNGILSQGQMADLSSRNAAFTCYADQCPFEGQHITARFSVPRYDADGSFDLENVIVDGNILRVDNINPFMKKIVLQFNEPLGFRPGETEDVPAQKAALV
ncbi:MAG: hypothetical protein K8R02_06065 [Anaerohalosphaeraceae bacterium]|nr:hypothetical protein [Anaerohalosphaeraceae bacterium]